MGVPIRMQFIRVDPTTELQETGVAFIQAADELREWIILSKGFSPTETIVWSTTKGDTVVVPVLRFTLPDDSDMADQKLSLMAIGVRLGMEVPDKNVDLLRLFYVDNPSSTYTVIGAAFRKNQ